MEQENTLTARGLEEPRNRLLDKKDSYIAVIVAKDHVMVHLN
jgi:hypothetical protein